MSTGNQFGTRRTINRAGWLGLFALVGCAVGLTAYAQFKRPLKREVWSYQLVAQYPHDPNAFTQGLAVDKGRLFEGTGKEGESTLRLIDVKTGHVEKMSALNQQLFGEGITVLDNRIYQLTWRNRVGIVYDADTMNIEQTFNYSGEGWGLTTDGKHLLLSDGSATIRFLNPTTFDVVKRITVRSTAGKVDRLNELEFVKNEIWANVWYEDRIVRISPEDGAVLGWIDLSSLYPRQQRGSREDVLNGIAYDAEHDRLYVTGKNWPALYEIKVVAK